MIGEKHLHALTHKGSADFSTMSANKVDLDSLSVFGTAPEDQKEAPPEGPGLSYGEKYGHINEVFRMTDQDGGK